MILTQLCRTDIVNIDDRCWRYWY